MKRTARIGCLIVLGFVVLMVVVTVVAPTLGNQDSPDTVAEREAKQQDAQEKLVACAANNRHGTLAYDTIFREHPAHVGQMVCFKGKIVQVQENRNDRFTFRINVSEGQYGIWSDTVYVEWDGQRFLEDDLVEFTGEVLGLKSYSSIFGQKITIPEIEVLAMRRLT